MSGPGPLTGARLETLLASLPTGSGVYIMRDIAGRVLYVGKARSLRRRVRSYFRRSGDDRPFVRELRRLLGDIEFVVTPSEKDALVLERRLIQQLKPRCNVALVDDKNFLSLLLVPGTWPRLVLARRRPRALPGRTPGRWFGPYLSADQARQLYRLVQQAFGLRTCNDRALSNRQRPCLLYQMGRCSAPCVGRIDAAAYAARVQQAEQLLRGRRGQVVAALEQRMHQAAQELNFEAAARLRDRLQAVQRALEQQPVVESNRGDIDVAALALEPQLAVVVILRVRDGCLLGVSRLEFDPERAPVADSLRQLLMQHYGSGADLPDRVLIDAGALAGGEGPLELGALAQWLGELAGRRVRVSGSGRGAAARLLAMARENAAEELRRRLVGRHQQHQRLERLQRRLALARLPRRIECVDLSTAGGRHSVGAVSVLVDGRPQPRLYRHYRIRGPARDDDLQMMREVVHRRLERLRAERQPVPDLLLLDGGRGHLGVVQQLLVESGLPIELAAIAKGRARRRRGQPARDEVYRPGRKNPWLVNPGDDDLLLLALARDEAHRFAIGYHRRLNARGAMQSELQAVPGVGPVLRRRLLEHFGSLEGVARATPEQLRQVKGVSAALAERLHRQLAARRAEPEVAGKDA